MSPSDALCTCKVSSGAASACHGYALEPGYQASWTGTVAFLALANSQVVVVVVVVVVVAVVVVVGVVVVVVVVVVAAALAVVVAVVVVAVVVAAVVVKVVVVVVALVIVVVVVSLQQQVVGQGASICLRTFCFSGRPQKNKAPLVFVFASIHFPDHTCLTHNGVHVPEDRTPRGPISKPQ